MKYILIILLSSFFTYSNELSCLDLSKTPVLNGGRVKTLLVLARGTIKNLTNKYSYQNESALSIFCKLNNSQSTDSFYVPIEHPELKKFLKLESTSNFDLQKAINDQELIKFEIMKQKENTSYKKALNKLWFRMDIFKTLISGFLWLPADANDQSGFSAYHTQFNKTDTQQAYKNILQASSRYDQSKDTSYQLENTLINMHVFMVSMLICLIALFFSAIKKSQTIALIFSISAVALQIFGISLRVLISGRAPITNMYETVLFSGLGALIISLIIYIFKKDKIYIISGLGYNILCLFMMKFSAGMLNEDISPLVPVLRDNFWLSTHVTTIILSYAALAISWIMANVILVKQRFSSLEKKEFKYYENHIYTSIKVGIVLLSAGIILGGIWADYSWGRFWGWDPKETWSLIVLLFYMAALHGKGTGWIKPMRFIRLSAFGFLTVMMAWFGVNYILASGLHSYGFSEGGAIFLGSFFAIQIALILITYRKAK